MTVDRAIPPFVLLVVGGGVTWAFSNALAARPMMVWALAGVYAPLVALSIWRMWRDGTLLDLFRFRSGDLTMGAVVALALGAATYGARHVLAPQGSPSDLLVMRVYLQLGEVPADRGAYALMSLAIVLVALAEEVVWRGLVQQVLQEQWGVRVGWLTTAVLYAAAHLPTVWLLGIPGVAKNPFLPVVALFCGTVWGFLVGRMQRLPPAMISHAVFTYALVLQLRLWSPG
jgi:hypothetical protein